MLRLTRYMSTLIFCQARAVEGRSVDAFERFLELDQPLLRLQLSPHRDRPPPQPALLREAMVLDHPLDACEPIAGVAVIEGRHALTPVRRRPCLECAG